MKMLITILFVMVFIVGCSNLEPVAEVTGKIRKYAVESEQFVLPALDGYIKAGKQKLEENEKLPEGSDEKMDDKEVARLQEYLQKASDIKDQYPDMVKKIIIVDDKIQALAKPIEEEKKEAVNQPISIDVTETVEIEKSETNK